VKTLPRTAVPPRARLRTYSHLAAARRVPDDYEIATSKLLYHPGRGLEVDLPFGRWYELHLRGSALKLDDWEAFADPRRTTYSRYTALMAEREAFVGTLSGRMSDTGYDQRLSPVAVRLFEEAVAPLRYPIHGLQMVAAYLGQLAPAGRIAIACAFQAADELRRIQHIARRIGQLRQRQPELGDGARARWEKDDAWQPLRQAVERLLVTWDWGEAFAALQLCLKPVVDGWIHGGLAARAVELGDPLFGEILASFDADALWHRQWAAELIRLAVAERPENRDAIALWSDRWNPLALAAIEPLAAAAGGTR
jgi:toluene monooxygenase system protein E